jgi:DNA-binding transcriptional regulator YiaG
MNMDCRYAAAGLDNVLLRDLEPLIDDNGQRVIRIANVNQLHQAIASAIVGLSIGMGGKLLRFLRTEMGLTQAELARIVHREPLAISRWERDEISIDTNAEVIIRLLACEMLGVEPRGGVSDIAARVVASASAQLVVIDGGDPNDYRPLAA